MSNSSTPITAKGYEQVKVASKTIPLARLAEYLKIDEQIKNNAASYKTSSKTLKDAFCRVTKDLDQLLKRPANVEESEKLKGEIKRLNEELKRASDERLNQITDDDIKKKIAEHENENGLNRQIIHEKAQENEQLKQEINKLKNEREQLTIEVAVGKKALASLQVEKEESNDKLIEQLKSQLSDTLNDTLNSRDINITGDTFELRNKIETLEATVKEKEKSIDDLKTELRSAKEIENELNEMLECKNTMLREANEEVRRLKKETTTAIERQPRMTYSQATAAKVNQPPINEQSLPQEPGDGRDGRDTAWLASKVQIRSRITTNNNLNNTTSPTKHRAVRPQTHRNPNEPKRRDQRRINMIAVSKKRVSLLDENETYEKVKSVLQPLIDTIEFADVYQNKKGKSIVKFFNKKDEAAIMTALSELDDEAERWIVGEKRRLMIREISNSTTKVEILNELKSRNGIQLSEDQLYVLNNPKYPNQRAIITLPESEAKRVLEERDRVRIGFKTCPIDKHVKPLQCFVCSGFNHSGYKHGRIVCENEPHCLDCAEPNPAGHQCKSEHGVKIRRCLNCKSTAHTASDRACPVYQSIYQDLLARW